MTLYKLYTCIYMYKTVEDLKVIKENKCMKFVLTRFRVIIVEFQIDHL